jgi:hypothetical protein
MTTKAIGYLPPAGAESSAMGNTGLLLQNPFCSANHQALMPWQKKAGIGFSFANNYGLKDINRVYITGVVPYKTFGYGFKLYNFGNLVYREQIIGMSVAHAFHPSFSLGLGVNYQSAGISNYGHRSTIALEASIAAKVNEQLSLGFRLYDPERAKFSDYQDERLATIYQFGMGYKVNKQVKAIAEIEKSNAFRPNVKMGINYAVKDNYNIRMGFSSLQPQFTFGFGFRHKQCVMEFASAVHQYLGVSTNISIAFSFGK